MYTWTVEERQLSWLGHLTTNGRYKICKVSKESNNWKNKKRCTSKQKVAAKSL